MTSQGSEDADIRTSFTELHEYLNLCSYNEIGDYACGDLPIAPGFGCRRFIHVTGLLGKLLVVITCSYAAERATDWLS